MGDCVGLGLESVSEACVEVNKAVIFTAGEDQQSLPRYRFLAVISPGFGRLLHLVLSLTTPCMGMNGPEYRRCTTLL